MELTFLGTASAYPTPSRGVSCIIFKYTTGAWMFDCGEGSQIQLMKSDIKPGKINKIFISHLHGDHLFGLPGLLCTIGQNSSDDRPPIDVYGPLGLRKFLRVTLELSRSQLGFDYTVHELVPNEMQIPEECKEWLVDHAIDGAMHPNEKLGSTINVDKDNVWHVSDSDGLTVKAGWLKHRVPSFGYVINEKPLPGKLDPSILKKKGVPPGPLYAHIKNGQSITAPSGEIIHPEDVLGPSRPGRTVGIMCDSSDSSQMSGLVQGADLIIHEATLEDGMEEKAIMKGHSTPGMAGAFAESVHAKQLIITHFSQRYKPVPEEDEDIAGSDTEGTSGPGTLTSSTCEDDKSMSVKNIKSSTCVVTDACDNSSTTATNSNSTVALLLQQACQAFPSGHTMAAHDFMKVSVKFAEDR